MKCLLAMLQWSRPQLRTETDPSSSNSGVRNMLQWSRPQLRTETYGSRLVMSARLNASMEPSSVEDGNRGKHSRDGLHEIRLQWSRPQLRTETLSTRRTGCSHSSFNGAVLS